MSYPNNNLDPRSNNPNLQDVRNPIDNSPLIGSTFPPPGITGQIPQLSPYTQPYPQTSPYSNTNFPSINSQTQSSIPNQGTNFTTTQLQVDPNTLLALINQFNPNALKLQPQAPVFDQTNTPNNLLFPKPLVNQMPLQPYPLYSNNLKYEQDIHNDYRERERDSYKSKRRSDAIIVCNLPHDITVDRLADEFEKYGKLKV